MTRVNCLLLVVLVLCALSLVSTQYQARRLHIALESAQDATRKLDVEWSQLQLDQASLSKHSLIDAAARRELDMVPASPARTEYLGLSAHPSLNPAAAAADPK